MIHGEFESADSIHMPDSLKFITPGGRTVYGGGGIVPDIFIPVDTTGYSVYWSKLSSEAVISQFSYDFTDKNRTALSAYKTVNDFIRNFKITESIMHDFVDYAAEKGVKHDEKGIQISGRFIREQIKAFIGRQLFRNNGFYPVIFENDKAVQKAVESFSVSRELILNKP